MQTYVKGEKFSSLFARHDTERRERHGLIWTVEELAALKQLYLGGMSLEDMAVKLKRPADGVLIKLRDQDLIKFNGIHDVCLVDSRDGPSESSSQAMTSVQETTMSDATKTIEVQTLIQGQDAAKMSDEQVFSLIAKMEAKIEALQKIKTKSTKLAAAIEKMQADVQALAEYVDNRVQ